MKTKVSPAVVGLFVLGAFSLALIALLSFGGVNFFSKPERFIVYFNESIHGLDLGSPVKLRGVRMGRVVDINLRYIPERNVSVVAVVCELSRNVIADRTGVLVDVSNREKLQALIDSGMRAQLGVIGLATGLLYVELNFLDPRTYPANIDAALESRYVVMPAMPSAISEFQANLTEILNDLKKIDYPAIGREVQGLLTDVRAKLQTVDAGALVAQWTRTGATAEALIQAPELKQTLANFAQASDQLKQLVTRFNTNGPDPAALTAALQDARVTIQSFNDTAALLQRFVKAQQNLGDDATRAFVRIGEAAAAVQQLADLLERTPTALLTGRPAP